MSFNGIPFFAWNKTSGVTCLGDLISTTNLQVYYKLNGGSTDSSGNGNNGTATSMTYGAGKFGDAGIFNGTTSRISMPVKNYSIASAYSFAAWIKTSSTAGQQITSQEYINRSFQFRIDVTTGIIRVVRFSNSTTLVSNFTSTAAVNTGSWVHVAMVFDNTVGTKIYINGSVDGSDAVLTNQNNVTTYGIDVGVYREPVGSYFQYFDGDIDEVVFYNRALTSTEITTLAAGTCPLSS